MSNVLLSDYGFSATPYEVYRLTKLMKLALKMKKRTEKPDKPEKFHRILREEIWYDCRYKSFEDLIKAIEKFMYYYNYERLTYKKDITPYQILCNAYKENKIDFVPAKETVHSVNLEKQKKIFVYRNPKVRL